MPESAHFLPGVDPLSLSFLANIINNIADFLNASRENLD